MLEAHPIPQRTFLPRECGEAAVLLVIMVFGAVAVAAILTGALLNEAVLAALRIGP